MIFGDILDCLDPIDSKVIRVIASSKTLQQLEVAEQYLELADKYFYNKILLNKSKFLRQKQHEISITFYGFCRGIIFEKKRNLEFKNVNN